MPAQACIAICGTVWPDAWRAHTDEVERRNLQIDHARLSATAVLSTEAEELQQVRERMEQLGVEPDPELEQQVRRERDAAGIPVPPWEK